MYRILFVRHRMSVCSIELCVCVFVIQFVRYLYIASLSGAKPKWIHIYSVLSIYVHGIDKIDDHRVWVEIESANILITNKRQHIWFVLFLLLLSCCFSAQTHTHYVLHFLLWRSWAMAPQSIKILINSNHCVVVARIMHWIYILSGRCMWNAYDSRSKIFLRSSTKCNNNRCVCMDIFPSECRMCNTHWRIQAIFVHLPRKIVSDNLAI